MAETIVENQICKTCGANVRKGALFCYSCGSSVASEILVVEKGKKKSVNDNQLQKSLPEENKNALRERKLKTIPEIKISTEEVLEKPIAKPAVQEESKLKSAAAMRRKSKFVQPKKVEIVWEDNETTPNIWFIAAAFALMVFVAVILFLALRMK